MKHTDYIECNSYKAALNAMTDLNLPNAGNKTYHNGFFNSIDTTESDESDNFETDIIKFQQSEFINGELIYNDINNGKNSIFDLPCELWPRTPLGYRWIVSNDNKASYMRHIYSVPVKTEVVVYGPDDNDKVNFITLFNDVNVQSFCYTRPADDTYCHGGSGKTKQINRYPSGLTTDKFKSDDNDKKYIRGHCIDYKDTIDKKTFSSSDKNNLLPEVNTSIYSNGIRSWHVHDIRKRGNAYMQLPYYDDKSNYHFYSNGAPIKTRSLTLVPKGVFLSEIDLFPAVKIRTTLDCSWNFPFSEKINNTSGTYRACAKPFMKVNNNTLPLSLSFSTSTLVCKENVKTNFSVLSKKPVPKLIHKSRAERYTTNCLLNYAEREIHSPDYKLLFSTRLSENLNDKDNTKSYLQRAKSHAIFLESLDDNREIINLNTLEKLETQHNDQNPGFEEQDDVDFWYRMYNV